MVLSTLDEYSTISPIEISTCQKRKHLDNKESVRKFNGPEILRKVRRFFSFLFSRNNLYRAILDSIPDGVIAIDIDGNVAVWNKTVVAMTGVEADQIIGKGGFAASLPFYGERRPLLVDLVLLRPVELEEYRKYYSRLNRKGETLTAEGFAPLVYGGKGM